MSFLRIRRRLKFYRNYLLWFLLISLFPTFLLLAFSFQRSLADAEESLKKTVDRAYREVAQMQERASAILNRIASAVKSDNPALPDILLRSVYQSAYFREAGVIDERGVLIMTSLGRVDPPVQISADNRSDPNVEGLQLLGPVTTTVMGESSIVWSLPTTGEGEVNLLVNPRILLYFLDVVDQVSLGPDGYIAFVKHNGQIIAADGMAPKDGNVLARPDDDGRMRAVMATPDGVINVVGEISRRWVLRAWREQMTIGAPLAVMSLFALVAILFMFFRRTEAFDYDLKAGLKNKEFEVHYQPIIDMRTGECAGSEALIRWRHPDEGVLLPGLFIPAAEKTGLIGPLGHWLVRQIVQEQRQLLERYPSMYVSINLSPIQLNSGNFDEVIRWLPESSVEIGGFVFEVTEATLIKEKQTTARDTLARARSLGCRIALDDFGTGYSSLGHLHEFEFDFLKIDRCFVCGINQGIRTNSILEAMVKLGHKLGVKIIAEGVETQEQREFLSRLGVHYAQGWLFSRPLPIRELEAFV